MTPKPGTRTTEFYVTLIVNLIAAVVAVLSSVGMLTAREGDLFLALAAAIGAVVAPLVMAYTTKAYVQSRAEVKNAAAWVERNRADDPQFVNVDHVGMYAEQD